MRLTRIVGRIIYPVLLAGVVLALLSVVEAVTASNVYETQKYAWGTNVGSTSAPTASNIDSTNKYAWGTNVGWINFNPTNGGVTVYNDHLEGYAWGENVGWIRMGTQSAGGAHTYANSSSSNYGVNNNGSGTLSGYAWGTNVGWINFNPTNGGVTIDPSTGSFDGYAWGENVGWIHFKNTSGNAYNVVTSWRVSTSTSPQPTPTPSNQPPQVHTPCPDITVIEGAADHVMNPFDCFSDPEGDHMMFYVTGNSNGQVVPNLSEGQLLGNVDQFAIQFGSVGETDITLQAKETSTHATTEDTFKVTVLSRPTLSISKSASSDSVSAGQRVNYTIKISNTGVSTATNTLISDTLPAGTSFVSNSIAASGVTTGTVGSQLPYLASGVTIAPSVGITLSYAVTISDTVLANQLITNTAQITSTEVITAVRASHIMQVISPTLSVADASADEAAQLLTFTATLSRRSATSVSVDYETVPDVASSDDYTATTGSLIIPAYSLTGTISVPIQNDLLTEADEAFSLRLSNAQNASLSSQSATGTIMDNDDDSDSDGVGAEMEDGVNENGDGNGDGVPDSQQAHITSLKSGTGDYVTFAAQEGQQLANMSSLMPTEEQTLDGVDFPLGLFDFAVTGLQTGAAFSLTLTLHNDQITPNSYWKYGPTADNPIDHWYNFAFDGTTGAQINSNTITLHFVDGARGDDDLTANGQITDPGAPAIHQPPTALELNRFGGQQADEWPTWLLVGMIMIAGLLVWRRRRKI